MLTPRSRSKFAVGTGLASGFVGRLDVPGELVERAKDAFNKATPPPGKMPSDRSASSILHTIPIPLLPNPDLAAPTDLT
jgi:hypothetical protein